MTRRALVVLPLLSTAVLLGWFALSPHAVLSPLPSAVYAQLPGRSEVGHGAIIRVEVVYEDGFVQVVSAGVDTATPPPPHTSTPVPSATPAPTLIPTNTPRPTATASPLPVESSPTPEDFNTPSPTPLSTSTPLPPTPTPTPPVGRCVLVVATDVLNVRAAPWGTVLGQVARGDYLYREGEVTASDGTRWYQVWWTETQQGYVYAPLVSVLSGTDCNPVAWLIHIVPGYNASELQASYPILANAGIGFGVKAYADLNACIQALDAGGTCIYRWPVGGDCPEKIGTADAVASANEWMQKYSMVIRPLMKYVPTHRFFLEVVNECYYGSSADIGAFYWWNTWMLEALRYAKTNSFPPLVMPTFGPGYGDDPLQISIWKPALLELAANGGLLGMHAYTPYLTTGLCGCDEWLACRHRRNYATLLGQGIDLHYSITESAAGWGNEPVSEADFVCWWDQIKHDPGLHSVALWIGGNHQTWPLANLDTHYVSLARKIATLP